MRSLSGLLPPLWPLDPRHVTFRLRIAARVAHSFAREARTEANLYGYPVHGCAFTQLRRIYGCSVSAPGDWQLLTRLRPHVFYEYIVEGNHITKRSRWHP